MRCVVGTIEVLSIPAGREEDLRTKTVWTVHSRKTTRLGIPTSLVVVETVVTNRLRCEVVTWSSLEWVASDHS